MSLLTTLLESSGSSTNNLLDFRGSYDASVNTFPATGGSGNSGAILKGDFWLISVGGTLGGSVVSVGDTIFATVDTPGQTAGNWAVLEGNIGYTPENAANKDASGGYAGLTLFKINFRNVANTFTSFFTNSNTAARTYTFKDRDGTIADDTDLALKAPLASPSFTGTINVAGLTASRAVITDGSKNLASLPYATTITPSSLAARDNNGNLNANLYLVGYTTTATAAGTTTLTVSSTELQYFTGTTTQTVVLPVTSTLVLGQAFTIINNSTGIVTVQSSGANTIRILEPGSSVRVTCILTSGTGVASWSASHGSSAAGALYTNNQTDTTYTFALTDGGGTVTASNAAASTYTLPQTSNVAFPIGTRIKLVNLGAGAVTLVKEGSETLIGNTSLNQYATAMIEKTSATQWQVFGGTAVVVEQVSVAIVNTLVNDKVYDIFVPNFSGTITGLSLRNTSVSTAGTYTAKINSTNITGLAAVANSATRTLTSATAANTFVNGDVISYTPTGTTSVVDAFITVYYTREY